VHVKRILFAVVLSFLPCAAFAGAGAVASAVTPETAKAPEMKLDINKATVEQLEGVPGIGPRMALAIVDLRAKKGSFAHLDDLLEIRGIGEKNLAALSAYLVAGSPAAKPIAAAASPTK
jgi:competence ComEA-like helix-hairpin-helix protein